MRHNKKFNHLGRTSSHRKALLSNMAGSLILHKRIRTTVAKAKALRQYIEPIITKAKDFDGQTTQQATHARRLVFKSLQNKEAVTELFREVAPKVGDREGGYTRILKTGHRFGDAAEMCIIELVDFNENMLKEKKQSTDKKRRSRRSKKKTTEETPVENKSVENVEKKEEDNKSEE